MTQRVSRKDAEAFISMSQSDRRAFDVDPMQTEEQWERSEARAERFETTIHEYNEGDAYAARKSAESRAEAMIEHGSIPERFNAFELGEERDLGQAHLGYHFEIPVTFYVDQASDVATCKAGHEVRVGLLDATGYCDEHPEGDQVVSGDLDDPSTWVRESEALAEEIAFMDEVDELRGEIVAEARHLAIQAEAWEKADNLTDMTPGHLRDIRYRLSRAAKLLEGQS